MTTATKTKTSVPKPVTAKTVTTVPRTTPNRTAVPAQRPTTTPRPKPTTISDTFDGDLVDPTIWHQITTDSNVAIAEQGGQLLITVGAGAARGGTYNQIDAHVGTQCRFPGDFDARVDYTLLEWPAASNVFVGLNAFFAGSAVGRESSSQWGDEYAGWVSPDSNGSLQLPDSSGSLRIARVGGIETTYIWHRGGWVRLSVGVSRDEAVLGLQAGSSDPTSAFGGREVKVAFDNFSVVAVNPSCPLGSEPGR